MKSASRVNSIKAFFGLIAGLRLKYVYASIRRRFIFYFVRSYFNKQMSRRKGNCFMEGHCCKTTIPSCPYFTGSKCALENKQPFFCKVFPIDEKDKELSDVKELCGYYFD